MITEYTAKCVDPGSGAPLRISKGGLTLEVQGDCFRAKHGALYRVTIERVRAPLPEHHEWEGNTIVRRGHPTYRDRSFVVGGGQVYTEAAGMQVVIDPAVIDAFRSEGLMW